MRVMRLTKICICFKVGSFKGIFVIMLFYETECICFSFIGFYLFTNSMKSPFAGYRGKQDKNLMPSDDS